MSAQLTTESTGGAEVRVFGELCDPLRLAARLDVVAANLEHTRPAFSMGRRWARARAEVGVVIPTIEEGAAL